MTPAEIIPTSQIEPLYVCGFWDVPLSGRCTWDYRDCWYEAVSDANGDVTHYRLIHLAPGLAKERDRRYELWEDIVGNTWRNPGWRRQFKPVKPGWRDAWIAASKDWPKWEPAGEEVGVFLPPWMDVAELLDGTP